MPRISNAAACNGRWEVGRIVTGVEVAAGVSLAQGPSMAYASTNVKAGATRVGTEGRGHKRASASHPSLCPHAAWDALSAPVRETTPSLCLRPTSSNPHAPQEIKKKEASPIPHSEISFPKQNEHWPTLTYPAKASPRNQEGAPSIPEGTVLYTPVDKLSSPRSAKAGDPL